MTKEQIIEVLDGRSREILHVIELLKKLDTTTQDKTESTQLPKVPEEITLSQLYLVNTNWGSNSLLRITLNETELDGMTAHRALVRYGHLKVSSFVENHVYINDVKEK